MMNPVRQVIEVVKQDDVAEGRRLADWFPGHAFDLDSAHWMVKLSDGGKPVVPRRNALAREGG